MATRASGVRCGCRGAGGDAPNWRSGAWNARWAYSCAAERTRSSAASAWPSLASVFCVLLGYMRIKRVPGGCGCIRWRQAPETTPEAAHLAGDGPQRDAVRRGHRRCDRPGGYSGRALPSLLRRVIGGICGLMSRCVAGRASERGGPGVAAGGEGCCAGFAVTRRAGYGTNAGICGSIGGSCTCLLRGVGRCFRLRAYPVPQAASRRLMPPRGMAGSSVRRGTRRRGGPR